MSFTKMVKTVKKRSQSIKILVVGLDNAGKSTVLGSYLGTEAVPAPTFGYKIFTVPRGAHTLDILDIGGQTSFRRYWRSYFENVDAAVLVIDCSDSRPVGGYLSEICELDVPVAVFCNKVDLNPGFEPPSELTKDHRFRCFKTSAIENSGIDEGFSWLIERASQSWN